MRLQKSQIVLVDTNVIIEAHRTHCWAAIADYFALETVEKCVEETQTGAQNRLPEQNIKQVKLKVSLSAVHVVTEIQRAGFLLKHKIPLDPGERDLLCQAESRKDAWILASPDKAAMRFMFFQGWIDRLVSLEKLVTHLKVKTTRPLGRNYTESWSVGERTAMALASLTKK